MSIESDFAFGAATSSYQIEGAWREDGKGPSVWDVFSHRAGTIAGGHTGDVACDHYHRWRDDVELMKQLGLTAYRFSVSWPRVLPDGRGPVNQAGLDFYQRLVEGLLEAGIEPWLTVYHWDHPQALEEAGGWPERPMTSAFAHYSGVLAAALGDRVRNWLTINEPWVVAELGYRRGIHAPGRTDPEAAVRASHHLLLAHGLAVQAIRAESSGARVGIPLNLVPQAPASDSEPDRVAARLADGRQNRWYLEPLAGRGYPEDVAEALETDLAFVEAGDLEIISGAIDVMGVNYYRREVVEAGGEEGFREAFPPAERTAMGWEVDPDGLTELLVRLKEEYPFLSYAVTETGAAYDDRPDPDGEVDDPERISYLERHLDAVMGAAGAGVPLEGLFVWSLLDNFEWSFGYTKRFGLVYVDFDTQVRTIKSSGHWYRTRITELRAGS